MSPGSYADPSARCYRAPGSPLNVFVAEEQTLDGPEDLTYKTRAQTGSIHIEVWTDRLLLSGRRP
jgi:hypothetical protein